MKTLTFYLLVIAVVILVIDATETPRQYYITNETNSNSLGSTIIDGTTLQSSPASPTSPNTYDGYTSGQWWGFFWAVAATVGSVLLVVILVAPKAKKLWNEYIMEGEGEGGEWGQADG